MSAFSEVTEIGDKLDELGITAKAHEADADNAPAEEEDAEDDDENDDLDETDDTPNGNKKDVTEPVQTAASAATSTAKLNTAKLNTVKYGMAPIYCAICTCPPEYCEYGPTYDQCLPWILQNCPELLSPEVIAKATGKTETEDGDEKEGGGEEKKKKKRGGASVPKKAAVVETKVYIARVQRQKRKFVTSVVGLDTVPDLKLKDAARVFGRKFSSGASIGDTATGAKEIVIQGDVSFELPSLLVTEFKISKSAIFLVDESGTRPYEG